MKIVEARKAPSAAVIGCMKGGKCDHCATSPKNHSNGPPNNPTSEWEKCAKSMAEVIAKKLEGPRHEGRKSGMTGPCPIKVRQQKPQKAWNVFFSVRTRNQVNSGAMSSTTRFMLTAGPSRISTAISCQRPIQYNYRRIARKRMQSKRPSLGPLPANSMMM